MWGSSLVTQSSTGFFLDSEHNAWIESPSDRKGDKLVLEENSIGLFEAIYTTRALRRFKPDPVPEEILFQLFDAAIRAPSSQNAQDWRFVIITEPAIKRRMQTWAEEGWQARWIRKHDK